MVENQHAYNKGRSTETALFDMFDTVQYALNRKGGGVCVIVFLDISGAFDRTWHAGMLYKMLCYKIPKYIVKIISAFLTGRSTYFSKRGKKHVTYLQQGCPQGGVLSFILWNILCNEMLGMECENGKKSGNVLKIKTYYFL